VNIYKYIFRSIYISAHSHYLSKINTGKTRTKKGISATLLLPNYTVIQRLWWCCPNSAKFRCFKVLEFNWL